MRCCSSKLANALVQRLRKRIFCIRCEIVTSKKSIDTTAAAVSRHDNVLNLYNRKIKFPCTPVSDDIHAVDDDLVN